MAAHNIQLIVVNGEVVLTGTVPSTAERSAIEGKAKTIAGRDHVQNDLKVKTATP